MPRKKTPDAALRPTDVPVALPRHNFADSWPRTKDDADAEAEALAQSEADAILPSHFYIVDGEDTPRASDTYEHVDADAVVTERSLYADDHEYIVEDAPTVGAHGQLAMMAAHDDDERERNTPALILQFKSADEVLSTAQALAARATDLRALAKKARDIGRLREAVSIEREAAHIGEALLPQVQAQTGFAFDDDETLLLALQRSVGRTVRNAAVRAIHVALSPLHGESSEDTMARRRELLANSEHVVGAVAVHAAVAVLPFVLETAERAYDAGLVARHATPNALAVQAVQAAAAKHDYSRRGPWALRDAHGPHLPDLDLWHNTASRRRRIPANRSCASIGHARKPPSALTCALPAGAGHK